MSGLGNLHVAVPAYGIAEIWEHDGDKPLALVRDLESAHRIVDEINAIQARRAERLERLRAELGELINSIDRIRESLS
jgi:hypothetical protein